MCGRKTLTKGKLEIIEELSVDEWDDDFEPGYNIAPTQTSPILRYVNNRKHVRSMKWGLIPSWSKDSSFASKMINARCETLTIKPAYKRLLSYQRGISIVDGYYEWQKTKNGAIPHYITREDGLLMLLPALWDVWKSSENSIILSYTVITCAASPSLKFIHNRMPVVIDPEQLSIWLDTRRHSQSRALQLLVSKQTGLKWYPVSTFVNNVKNNSPKCIEPVR